MYISGTVGNFMSRLHQLPSGLNDLSGRDSSFLNEGISYSIYPIGLQETWNREYNRKYSEITHTGITGHIFKILSPFLTGNGSDTILWNNWSGGSPYSWNIENSLDNTNWIFQANTVGTDRNYFVDTDSLYYRISGLDNNNRPVTLISNVTSIGI